MELKPCSKCKLIKPLSEFYKDKTKKSGYKSQCKDCLATDQKREYARKYRLSHPDYFLEKHAEYRARNREKLKEDSKKRRLDDPDITKRYYLKNRERILAYQNEYRKTERGKGMQNARRFKRRLTERIGDKDITLEKLYNRACGICALCGGLCDYDDYIFRDKIFIAGNRYPSIDHIIPISKGGSHTWDNVQLAHRQCNSIKNNKKGG